MAKLTKDQAIEKIRALIKDTKTLFPADATNAKGHRYHDTIEAEMNAEIDHLVKNTMSRPESSLGRCQGFADDYQGIARQAVKKGLW